MTVTGKNRRLPTAYKVKAITVSHEAAGTGNVGKQRGGRHMLGERQLGDELASTLGKCAPQ